LGITIYTQKDAATATADSFAAVHNDIVYTNLQGERVYMEDTTPAVRVVNSWATWCPFCTKELGDFDAVAAEFENANVEFIAVNRSERVRTIQSFLDSMPKLEHVKIWLDSADAFYKKIGGFSMPETIVYDKYGEIVLHKRGPITEDEMRKIIVNTLDNQ